MAIPSTTASDQTVISATLAVKNMTSLSTAVGKQLNKSCG